MGQIRVKRGPEKARALPRSTQSNNEKVDGHGGRPGVENMPVPKKKTSSSKRDMRRSHHALTAPQRDILISLRKVTAVGLLTGDIDNASLGLRSQVLTMYFCGEPLDMIMSQVLENAKKFQAWGQHVHGLCQATLQQLLENLMDVETDDDPCTLTGTYMEEESWLEKAKQADDDLRFIEFWLHKLSAAVILGELAKAKEFMEMLTKCNVGATAGGSMFDTYFYIALVNALLAREQKNGINGKVNKCKGYLKKLRLYCKNYMPNVNNKIWLVEAELELLNVSGRSKSNMCWLSKFQQSIEAARRQGHLREEAYGNERCAIAMLEYGHDVIQALEYFHRAKNLYEQWGSAVKVRQLIQYVEENTGVTMSTSMPLSMHMKER